MVVSVAPAKNSAIPAATATSGRIRGGRVRVVRRTPNGVTTTDRSAQTVPSTTSTGTTATAKANDQTGGRTSVGSRSALLAGPPVPAAGSAW